MAKRKIRMLICGRKKPDTSLLIAGSMRIYAINVSRHMDCLKLKSTGSSKLADLILKPKEIRAFLDQYVIGQDQTKSNVSCGLQSLQTFDAAQNGR
jgi:ATP-dependent Clp protease ATP-binding subunit ClpX